MLISAHLGAFVFICYLENNLVDLVNNQNINQPGLNAPKKSDTEPQEKDPKKEVERLQKELQDKIELSKVRLQGNETNIKTLEKEIKEAGVWAKVSGHKAALEKELKADRDFRQNLLKQQAQLEKTSREAQRLMSQGKVEEAQALLLGKEVQRKQDLQKASSQYMSGLKEANSDMHDADVFLGRVETGLKAARNTAVIVGATVATGGAAGALMAAGYGTAAVAGGAILAGTATGTGIGGLSNVAKATEEVVAYGKDAKEAFSEAASQTLQDAKSSAIASAGTVTGMGVAGKIAGEGASMGMKILAGSAAGGTNAAVSTTESTAEKVAARIKAEQEFTSTYGEQTKNMTPEQVNEMKQQFLEKRGLTTKQMTFDAAVDVGVGLVSGGQGSKAQGLREATNSTLKKVLVTSGEAALSAAQGVGSTYLKKGELSVEDVIENTTSSGLGSYIGGISTKGHHDTQTETSNTKSSGNGTHEQTVPRENNSHPLGEAAPVAGAAAAGGLIPKQKPPVPEHETASPQSGQLQKPPEPNRRLSLLDTDDIVLAKGGDLLFDEQIIHTSREAPEKRNIQEADNGKKWPTKIEPENLPSEIQNDNSFKAANRGDKKTVIFEDPNLEEGIGGDAINLSRSSSEDIHRVRLKEDTVEKMNDPSSPEHTSSVRYIHEEIAHTHQTKLDPTNMSREQFIAENIMNELVAKNTSNVKIGRENRGQDFGKLREAINKGDYASAREFAEAWGKKHGADCGFDADFYYDFYGKWHDDANSGTGSGRTEVRKPSLATEEESGTGRATKNGNSLFTSQEEVALLGKEDIDSYQQHIIDTATDPNKPLYWDYESSGDAKLLGLHDKPAYLEPLAKKLTDKVTGDDFYDNNALILANDIAREIEPVREKVKEAIINRFVNDIQSRTSKNKGEKKVPLDIDERIKMLDDPEIERGIKEKLEAEGKIGSEDLGTTPRQRSVFGKLENEPIARAKGLIGDGVDINSVRSKIQKVIDEHRAQNGGNIPKGVHMTSPQARRIANALGYKVIPGETIKGGEPIFSNGRWVISSDIDVHGNFAWKVADSVEALCTGNRAGTMTLDLLYSPRK